MSSLGGSAADHPYLVPGSVRLVDDVRDDPTSFPEQARVLGWIDSFVLQPNDALGRPGHVCPRLAPVVGANRLAMVSLRPPSDGVDAAVESGHAIADLYRALFPDTADHKTAALLAVFPDVAPEAAHDFIDGGHKALRMEYVSSGLMLGEFHAASQVGSVRNEELVVMQSPLPMYAVRGLTPHDILFLDRPTEDPARRIAYLEHYLYYVGPTLAASARTRVSATLDELKAASV
ncbi:MAG: hypothetical protein LCI03_14275 [Actinobacteria bacterium]|jgi:hypothetical protein|nr:hypothetical protein [Actinomycetota bacterium]